MITRTLSRWLMSVVLAALALVAINLLVTTSPVQGRPAAALINCSGSIQACIDAANDGDTILIAASTYTESLTLSKPVSLTGISSDTTIIHAVEGQRVLTVTGAAISNSVVISGLTFTGGNADHGGGMLLAGSAHPLIRNSVFTSNKARFDGGGLYSYDAVTLGDVNFISNTAAGGNGGGLYAEGISAVSASHFMSNAASYDGGGGYFWGNVTIENTRVERNSSGYRGGGFHTAAIALISGTSFISNSANSISRSTNGGGLWASFAVVTNSQFISNSAQGGGGMHAYNSIITGSRFESNVASLFSGGGLDAGDISITETDFYNNSAMVGGGGAYLLGPVHIINKVRAQGNYAAFDGGGLHIGGSFQMINSQLLNNTAQRNGGGIWQAPIANNPSNLANVIFADNLAEAAGSAIFVSDVDGSASIALQHVTVTDRDLNSSSAIAALTGTLNLTNTIIANHAIGISNTDGTVYEDYNLFFNTITNTVGVITDGGHSLIGDPKFVDSLNGDYHLQFGSAAIDHGVDAGVYVDLDGNLRPSGIGFDIGAYEYQGARYLWLPLIWK